MKLASKLAQEALGWPHKFDGREYPLQTMVVNMPDAVAMVEVAVRRALLLAAQEVAEFTGDDTAALADRLRVLADREADPPTG